MRQARQTKSSETGFSLIELTATIVITGILAVGLSNLLQHPMNGYAAVSRRAELVALGELAIGRMTRDLQQALPNSVRVSGSGEALEFLLASAGGRYRSTPGVNDAGGPSEQDHTDATDWLSFGGDSSFNLIGRFQNLGVAYGTALAPGSRLAIYPTGVSIWSEAAGDLNPAVISPSTSSISVFLDGDEDQIRLSAAHEFRLESPSARVFVVDTPITYLCDGVDNSLWRIERYAIVSSQPSDRSASPLASGSTARVADLIETCRFDYVAGTASRAGLVTVELALTLGGERVRLLQQVQVQNAP